MARFITVNVVNKEGYGLSGYTVKTYGGDGQKTDRNGTAVVQAEGNQVSIYVNGTTVYSGSTANCENPLTVQR